MYNFVEFSYLVIFSISFEETIITIDMDREEISEPSPPSAPQNYIIIPFAIEANRVA